MYTIILVLENLLKDTSIINRLVYHFFDVILPEDGICLESSGKVWSWGFYNLLMLAFFSLSIYIWVVMTGNTVEIFQKSVYRKVYMNISNAN
jgi:hypothetical protein